VTIRSKLYAAVAIVITGLALTAGAGIWGMWRLSDAFDSVQRAADARAVALQLKFGVTDFNGWQTAYGYDNGVSRPVFLASVAQFRRTLKRARIVLTRPRERRLLQEITRRSDEFMRIDAQAWTALQAGRAAEVRRLFLGPEIRTFQRTARAAQALSVLESADAARAEHSFRSARRDALRYIVGAAVVAGLLVVVLLVTALDLARSAERALERSAQPPRSGV
jgi:hypothetical protein